MRRLDIIPGEEYGKLKILKEIDPYISPAGNKERRFECICSCGNKTTVTIGALRSGKTKSCGCGHYDNDIFNKRRNIKAEKSKYKNIEFLRKTEGKNHQSYAMCECSMCGKGYKIRADALGGSICKECGHKLFREAIENEHKDGTCLCRLSTKPSALNSTGVRGVSFKKGRYEAYIKFAGKNHYLGRYVTIEEAKEARRIAEEKFWAPVLDRYGRELK